MTFTFILGLCTFIFLSRAVMTEIVNHPTLFAMSSEARNIRSQRWFLALFFLLALSYRLWG